MRGCAAQAAPPAVPKRTTLAGRSRRPEPPTSMSTTSTAADLLTRVVRAAGLLPPDVVDAYAQRAAEEGVPFDQFLAREAGVGRADLLRLLENHFFCAAVDVT